MIKLNIRAKRTLGFATTAVASIFLAIVLSIFAHTERAEKPAKEALEARKAQVIRKQTPINYTPPEHIKHVIVLADDSYRNVGIYLNFNTDTAVHVAARGKSGDLHDSNEFAAIDLTQAKWRVQDDALVLDLSASLIGDYSYGQYAVITLPRRDWEISLPDNLGGDYRLNNTGEPLNISVWSKALRVAGQFKRLSLWKLPGCSHPCLTFDKATVEELHAYAGDSVVNEDQQCSDEGVSLRLSTDLDAKAIYLHSQPNSRVDLQFLPDLKHLRWQPLQPADVERYVTHQQVVDKVK